MFLLADAKKHRDTALATILTDANSRWKQQKAVMATKTPSAVQFRHTHKKKQATRRMEIRRGRDHHRQPAASTQRPAPAASTQHPAASGQHGGEGGGEEVGGGGADGRRNTVDGGVDGAAW